MNALDARYLIVKDNDHEGGSGGCKRMHSKLSNEHGNVDTPDRYIICSKGRLQH